MPTEEPRRLRIPNRNFTLPVEDQVRAVQGLPAFVRRALRLEARREALERDLEEWHRREFRTVATALAGVLAALRGGGSRRGVRRALGTLRRRVERYNARRRLFLAGLDLEPLNAEIRGYNRYYLIEREAWWRGQPGALAGPVPLEAQRQAEVTREDLERWLPPLELP
jgi:hypothetical protein